MAEQSENIVFGDQSAGDIDKSTHYHLPQPTKPALGKLIEKYEKEKANDIIFNSMVDKLQHFSSSQDIEGETIIGLEAKLKAGNCSEYIEHAIKLKEIFVKRLIKLQLYESAQKILAFLLADIYGRFHNTVYPLIKQGNSQDQVFNAIQEDIIDPIHKMFEECFLSLDLYKDEINGAIYFLTGNCHIKWV